MEQGQDQGPAQPRAACPGRVTDPAPEGHSAWATSRYGGWAFKFDRGEEGDKFKSEELMSADALLLRYVRA
jgi:hypothetical protein